MKFTPEFKTAVESWKNENDYNNAFHADLFAKVNADPELQLHRDFVEENAFGFGDRPFHYVWKMLVDQLPKEFSFLEIGVFKGQVVSLVSLLAKRTSKQARIYGVTTLDNTPDNRCQYPSGNYLGWINDIFNRFNLNFSEVTLWKGKSNDPAIVSIAAELSYDIVYIDGGHDYETVVSDIKEYAHGVKPGGFLVMDDSSNFLNIGTCWPGLEEASRAVRDILEPDKRFKHLFACGHLRVFQRVDNLFKEIPFIPEMNSATLEFSGPRWTSPEDVRTLIWLAKKTDGAILEIGCNEGRTTRELALANPEKHVVGIDYSHEDDDLGVEQKTEKPPTYALGYHVALLANAMVYNMKSSELKPTSPRLPLRVGFIFIDGNHNYLSVKRDTELALQIIERNPKGGIIAWHDCYKEAPDWVGVWGCLQREFSLDYQIQHIEGGYIAFLDLTKS